MKFALGIGIVLIVIIVCVFWPANSGNQLPVYNEENAPYYFSAILQNEQNDTLEMYQLEMGFQDSIGSKKENYFSFSSAGPPQPVYWKIINMGLNDSQTVDYKTTTNLIKAENFVELELPSTGPMKIIAGADKLQVYTEDVPGSEHKLFGYKGNEEKSGLFIFKSKFIFKGKSVINIQNKTVQANYYTGETTYQDRKFTYDYWFHPEIGFVKIEYRIPVKLQYSFEDEIIKLTILQVPKNKASHTKST